MFMTISEENYIKVIYHLSLVSPKGVNTNAIAGIDTRVTSNTASITSNTSAISGIDSRVTTNTSDIALKATIASPSFTGTPTAPTAPSGTNTKQIATTAFVYTMVG